MDKLVKQKLNKPAYGLIIGLILPALLTFLIFVFTADEGISMVDYYQHHFKMGTFIPIFSFAVLINVIPFYIFKHLEMWYVNKGVVFSIFLYLIFVVIMKVA